MGLSALLSQAQSIYLDTNLYIYFFEDKPKLADKVEEVLNQASDQQIKIICSPLLFTELLVDPLKTNNLRLIETYQNLPHVLTNMEVVDLNYETCCAAAELRATYNLKTPDSLHVATAIRKKANYFLTSDKNISRVKEMKVIEIV